MKKIYIFCFAHNCFICTFYFVLISVLFSFFSLLVFTTIPPPTQGTFNVRILIVFHHWSSNSHRRIAAIKTGQVFCQIYYLYHIHIILLLYRVTFQDHINKCFKDVQFSKHIFETFLLSVKILDVSYNSRTSTPCMFFLTIKMDKVL